MKIKEKLKKDNLEYKVEETDNFIVLTLEVIKPVRGQSKTYLKVFVNADRLTAELDENSGFALEEFNYNKIDSEISC